MCDSNWAPCFQIFLISSRSFQYPTAKPAKKWWFKADYHLLFRDRNTFSGQAGFSDDGCFRGQLFTAIVGYDQNEHIKHHLMVDAFLPGNYYSDARNDVAFFMKYQVMFTW